MQQYGSLILLIGLFAVMYFLMIRPQQKKEKETRAMRDSLRVGDEIITIGGMIGRVTKIQDDRVTFATSVDRTKIEVSKWAIQAINGYEKGGKRKETTEEPAEKGKPSPKNIRKLGEKPAEPDKLPDEQAAEAVAEAAEVTEKTADAE